MTELILIKTENGQELKDFLKQKHIDYEIFYDQEDKLLQEYREAWQDPQRLVEAKQ
jgi:hypothetical protein